MISTRASCPWCADIINAQIGPDYLVKIDEHVYIHDASQEARALVGRADVAVARPDMAGGTTSGTAVLEAPCEVRFPAVDIERETFLEIRDRRSRQLVTVIELLSPSNKNPGPDREQYINNARTIHRQSGSFC